MHRTTVLYKHCHVLFLSPGRSRAAPLWLRLERRTSRIWTTTSLRSALSEYFQVQGGYLDISWDAQSNRQDLHGLHGQLVFIVSRYDPQTPEPKQRAVLNANYGCKDSEAEAKDFREVGLDMYYSTRSRRRRCLLASMDCSNTNIPNLSLAY